MVAVQKGKNPKYPNKIETWRQGEKIPEWLIDRAKVTSVGETGEVTLRIIPHNTSKEGYDIIESGPGLKTFVSVSEKDGYVCFGDNHIFSLRPIQFQILYKEEKK